MGRARRTVGTAVLTMVWVGTMLSAGAGRAAAAVGEPGNGGSNAPAVSNDDRYVAFISDASDLLGGDPANDPNGVADVFVLDTVTGTIRIVSSAPDGTPANGPATEVDISGNGRYVAFVSEATNLLDSDANGSQTDVFRYDLATGTLSLVSRRGAAGVQGNGASWNVSISDDGSLVAFTSYATNLVGNDTNKAVDAFVRDVAAGTTTRVSTSSTGKQGNGDALSAGVSGNGAVVAFASSASNLITGDTNGARDVFVKVLGSGKTTRVSVSSKEKQANNSSSLSAISTNGKLVVFTSDASNLVGNDTNAKYDVFLRDRTAGTTARVSQRGTTQGNASSYAADISGDGAYVAFVTTATNLGGSETDANGTLSDVYEYEVATKTLRHVSVDSAGTWPDGASFDPAYGSDGMLAFASSATNLVSDDANGVDDVFTRTFTPDDRSTGITALVSRASAAA